MKATLLKRYDSNGAFTHDFAVELGEFTPSKDSMWRFAGFIDVDLNKEFKEKEDECFKCHESYTELYGDAFCPHCLTLIN